MLRLLVVEDAPQILRRTVERLTVDLSGYEVLTAENRDDALASIGKSPPDLVLLDLTIPPSATESGPHWAHGQSVLQFAKGVCSRTKVIILSSHGDLTRDFIKRHGADDFFTKDTPEAWEQGRLPARVAQLIGHLACRSAAMAALRTEMDQVSDHGGSLLITGAPGAGKRHVAGILYRYLAGAGSDPRELSLPLANEREINEWSADPDAGCLLLTGLERFELLDVRVQLTVAALLAERKKPGPQIVVTSTLNRAELVASDAAAPELAQELSRCWHLHVPSLAERTEDLAELAETFSREAAIEAQKRVRALSSAAQSALSEALATGLLPGEAKALRARVAEAVLQAQGDQIQPGDLRLSLPAEYRVLVCHDGRTSDRPVTGPELESIEASSSCDLILRAEHRDGSWSIAEVVVNAERHAVEDDRLGRILHCLASQPGIVVPIGEYKREFGLLQHERVRRYISRLRQLLGDTDVQGRESRYVTSHYSEKYEFRTDADYMLTRRLREPSDQPDSLNSSVAGESME